MLWGDWEYAEHLDAASRLRRMVFALAKEGKLNDLRKAIMNRGGYLDLANWVNYNGMNLTPLLVAAYNNHPHVVKYLIAEGGDMHSQGGFAGNLLRSACNHADASLMRQLFESGYYSVQVMGFDQNVRTALVDCIESRSVVHDTRSVALVKLLTALPGVNINARVDDLNNSALILACDRRRPELALILLSHPGIDVNAQNTNGLSALMCAARGGNGMVEVVQALLAHPDIDLHLCNKSSHNALVVARSALYVDTRQNIALLEKAMSQIATA